ncbi:MAG: hypothetical protein R3179_05225 [Sedimenticolaceae bacterium]|nr:hypothetical protein [Sedimenticolaceae bacterium]
MTITAIARTGKVCRGEAGIFSGGCEGEEKKQEKGEDFVVGGCKHSGTSGKVFVCLPGIRGQNGEQRTSTTRHHQ